MIPSGLGQLLHGQVGPVDPGPAPLPGGPAAVVRFFMDVPQSIQIAGVFLGAMLAIVLIVVLWRHRASIPARIRAIPTPVRIVAIGVLLVVGTVAGVAGYRVYDFVEYDNRFCTGCHVMADAFVRFEESAHNELGCKDCHAQPKTESARQLYLWVLERPMEVGPHSPVKNEFCMTCHLEQDAERWPQIAESVGHRVHFESEDPELGGLMCVTCHGVTVHEFRPVDRTCGDCHRDESRIVLGRMAAETELHCVVCHDFLGRDHGVTRLEGLPEGIAMLPDRSQCLGCHQMAAFFADGAFDTDPHGAVCGACHDPHRQESPDAAVGTCRSCHVDVESITVFHTGTHAPYLDRCTACHQAHGWRVVGNDCVACHGTIPDERQVGSSGYLPASGAVAEALSPEHVHPLLLHPWASLAIHGVGGIGTPGGGVVPAGVADDRVDPRPFEHRTHEGVSCVRCHGRTGEHGVLTVRAPADCAACHHDPAQPYGAFGCADCHGSGDIPAIRDVQVAFELSVRETVRLRDLRFEHALHEDVSCQECHIGPVFLAVEVGCAACHADHHRPEAGCATCHSPIEEGVHELTAHLSCTSSGCHADTDPGVAAQVRQGARVTSSPEARPFLSRTLCLACHAEQRDHEPGLDCHSCHLVPAISPPWDRGGATSSRSPS